MFKKGVLLTLVMLVFSACAKPPTNDQVQSAIKGIIPVPFQVIQITELEAISGLYEVVLKVNDQPVVLYMDKKTKYVFSGSLMAIENKTNLTQETQMKFLKK